MNPVKADQTTHLLGSRWATEIFFLGLLLLIFTLESEVITYVPYMELEALRISLGLSLITTFCFFFAYRYDRRLIRHLAAFFGLVVLLNSFNLLWCIAKLISH